MGNLNCCNCIEKKETQLNQLSNHECNKNDNIKNKINPIKTIEFIKLKDNKENKYEEKLSFYSLDEEDKNATKRTNKSNSNKFNETTQSYTISKDISFKYTKKDENTKYFQEINYEDKINDLIIGDNKDENCETNNKNKNDDIKDKKYQFINLKYYNTDCKRSNFNIYFNSYDIKKTDENISQGLTLNYSNCLPIKYNYRKDKYISYFTDENI